MLIPPGGRELAAASCGKTMSVLSGQGSDLVGTSMGRGLVVDSSIKLEDITTDPIGQSDGALSSQTESIPVNLMDRNFTQRELSVASGVASDTSLRPDVLALGFHSFHHEFDPKRVLCIYSVSEDAVKVQFFHAEGMEMLFGFGLAFSCVLLRKGSVKEGVVEVDELKQQVWINSWSKSEMWKFSLFLFDCTVSTQLFGSDSAPRNRVESFPSEQAAEQFGVGLEGADSYIRMGEFQHDVSNVTAVSPSWIASLYDFLRCRDHAGSDGEDKVLGCERNLCNLSTPAGLSLSLRSGSAQGTYSHEDPHRSQGQELPEVTAIERRMQSQPRQLTVIIRLDPEDCIFFSPRATAFTDRAAVEMRLDRESSFPRFVNLQTGEVLLIDADPALCKFSMVPEVTIKFFYDPRLWGCGSKKMTTTLDVNFLIEGTVSDPEKFGWYHDHLRLSFECKRPREVRRDPESRETEILSKHEVRTADRGCGRANSTAALEGKGQDHQMFAGHRTYASVQISRSSKQENTVGSSENHELSTKVSAVCLVGANFCIQKVGGHSELAYRATIFPPFHQYNVWDWVDRELALASGMMSAVRIRIEGDWEVREDDENLYTSSSPAGRSEEFCKYEFSCERELKLLRKSQVGRVQLLPISVNPEPQLFMETKQWPTAIHQKLVRGFLINHRFSHMQRLERPYPYVWDMVRRPQAPCPRPADQILRTELQQWQRRLPTV